MRTLIVEDTLINQEFLKMVMEERGECVVVESGEEAIDAFGRTLDESIPFDLIFMDVMLPGIDGLQTLERIRALENERGISPGSETKTIITTALEDNTKATHACAHGATSYITKPIRQKSIEDELRKFGLID